MKLTKEKAPVPRTAHAIPEQGSTAVTTYC